MCALSLALLKLSAQENQVGIPPLTGMVAIMVGDEFNGTSINRKLWGLYGDKTKRYSFDTYGNNKDQGMAQTLSRPNGHGAQWLGFDTCHARSYTHGAS